MQKADYSFHLLKEVTGMDLDVLYEIEEALESIYRILGLGTGIAELGIGGIVLIGTMITALVGAVFAVVRYILEAFPVYKVAKKVGRKHAWLAWVPIFPSLFRMYVLSDIAGDKPVEIKLFGKNLKFQNRILVFFCYVGIGVFGAELLTIVLGIFSIIPIIGQIVAIFGSLFYLLPPIAEGIIEYIYLRDVLDKFKENKASNRKTSIIVTILDSICTLGFARVVILYTIMNKEVLPETVVDEL